MLKHPNPNMAIYFTHKITWLLASNNFLFLFITKLISDKKATP